MNEFTTRHINWSADSDSELLMSEVMTCLEESKKNLSVHVRGKVIYAEVEPEHLVEDLLALYLYMQFPEYYVVLASSRGTFIAGKDMAGVVRSEANMGRMVSRLNISSAQ